MNIRKSVLNSSGRLLLAILTIYASTLQCKEANMPYFEAMVGEGNLIITYPAKDTVNERAILKKTIKESLSME